MNETKPDSITRVPDKEGMFRVEGSSDAGKRLTPLAEVIRVLSEPVPPFSEPLDERTEEE